MINSVRCLIWYWGTGGAGIRFTHRVACEIGSQIGSHNICLSLHEKNAWIDKARSEGFVVEIIGGPFGFRQSIQMVLSLPSRLLVFVRQLNRFNPDVLVIPMNFALAWPLVMVARMKRIKVVYVVHDASPHPGEYFPRLLNFTQSRIIKQASRLVTLSDYVRASLMYLYPLETHVKPVVIPLSSHCVQRRDTAAVIEGLPVRFLFLGRMLRYKGLDVILGAAKLMEHRRDWQLTFAGNGSEVEELKREVGTLAQIDMSLIGWLTESEIDSVLETHHVLLCPYLEASQSGVISEAASYGMPSIVASVGGLADQIGKGRAGWLCKPGSPESLAEAMIKIIENDASYSEKAVAALARIPSKAGTTPWGTMIEGIALQAQAASAGPERK